MANAIDPASALAALVKRAAVGAFGDQVQDVDPAVRRSEHADLQADLAMGLAKRLKKPPRAIGEAIAAGLAGSELVERVEVAGPGFVNVWLRDAWLAEAATAARADARLGVALSSAPERVVVDYSGPNVAKEMHVGHLRSTVIGDSLSRLLEHRGHTVIRQNHLGDWGTPFGMLIEHMLDRGATDTERSVAVGELSSFYQEARTKFDADATFAERARQRVVLLQAGDPATLEKWRVLVDLSKRYFDAVYTKLDVTLRSPDAAGESFYNPRLAPLVADLEASGAATRSDGALCAFPKGFTNKEGEPLPLIVQKRDGGFGYATTDLAAVQYRLTELRATRLLYVVGAPQQQHFAMVFAVARALGWFAAGARAEHVMFGSILGTDKRMFRTRSGDTVRLVDLIDAAIERADSVVREKAPDLDELTRREVANAVGVGAIKYADLSSDRIKDYVFDLERMVSFDGNSAGYVQFAHARSCSILRKAGDAPVGPIGPTLEPPERSLVLTVLALGAAIEKVEATLEPHHLAGYAYALATATTEFLERCPVLKAEPAVRASRLALTDLAARAIRVALELLGVRAPPRM